MIIDPKRLADTPIGTLMEEYATAIAVPLSDSIETAIAKSGVATQLRQAIIDRFEKLERENANLLLQLTAARQEIERLNKRTNIEAAFEKTDPDGTKLGELLVATKNAGKEGNGNRVFGHLLVEDGKEDGEAD